MAENRSQKGPSNSNTRRYALSIGLILIIPLILSWYLTPADVPAGQEASTKNIILVQPNIDPWDEKFAAGKEQAQLLKLIRLSESQIDSNTALVVWPETAIPVAINEDEMKSNYFMAPVWDFLKRHPSVNLLTGVEGFRFYDEKDKTPYSSRVPESNKYADTYNSAALLDSSRFQVYHKSKLVPGPEHLPSFLKFMSPLFEKFGGTTDGYAQQSERTVLSTYNHTYHIAPAVCYESIYGEFMTSYIRNQANLIVVITNDGWWGNTPGYRQHVNYARLRAIETRCWVARSANTGISCFITPAGEIIDPQPWWKTAVIRHAVPVTPHHETFYVKYGDLLSKGAVALTILLIIGWLVTLVKNFKPKARRA